MPAFDFDPKRYPTDAGCYLMKDAAGTVMYVGKAKNLRKRISSYFHKGHKRRYIRNMIRRIRDIEVLIVNNETESLILETNLIRRYRPGTNRAKMHYASGHPYIVLTDEKYPRFVPFRKHRVNRDLGKEGIAMADRRFGPYLSSDLRDSLLSFVNEHFKIRTCYPMPKAVCLSYHLGTCGGICEQRVSDANYEKRVEEAVRFLSLKHTDILHQMRERMENCAEQELFLRAARIRDQMVAVDIALEKQIVERDIDYDQDVIFIGQGEAAGYAQVMYINQGMIWGMDLVDLTEWEQSPPAKLTDSKAISFKAISSSEWLAAQPIQRFLLHRYAQDAPKELILNDLPEMDTIASQLSRHHGKRIQITMPCRGIKAHLLTLCQKNFHYRVQLRLDSSSGQSGAHHQKTDSKSKRPTQKLLDRS